MDNNIEFDKIFNRLKNTKNGAAVDFVKPAVFAMDKNKWRVYAFGSDIETNTGWVRCHRFLCFANNPKQSCYSNMVPESAINVITIKGDKATIEFKRDNTEYKVQLDLSEHK